jgi:hypothetical protein
VTSTVVIEKLNETGIFNASAFVFRNGKDHPLGYAVIGVETHLIIGIRKPAHDLEGSVLDVSENCGFARSIPIFSINSLYVKSSGSWLRIWAVISLPAPISFNLRWKGLRLYTGLIGDPAFPQNH